MCWCFVFLVFHVFNSFSRGRSQEADFKRQPGGSLETDWMQTSRGRSQEADFKRQPGDRLDADFKRQPGASLETD